MFEHLNILDEKYAEIVAKAVADDRISCTVQGVRSVLAPSETLCGECLARLTGSDRKVYAASIFAPGLNTLRKLLHLTDFDIIKIEETFIHDIRPFAEGRNSQNIIGLASSFAPLGAIFDQRFAVH